MIVARKKEPITSILINFTLGSRRDFDVGLSLIGSKEMVHNLFPSFRVDVNIFTYYVNLISVLFSNNFNAGYSYNIVALDSATKVPILAFLCNHLLRMMVLILSAS